jgi:hypothetical protein
MTNWTTGATTYVIDVVDPISRNWVFSVNGPDEYTVPGMFVEP